MGVSQWQEGVMQVELNITEMNLIVRLIEAELEEISPEIHHSTTSKMRVELRRDRDDLRNMLTRFYELLERPPLAGNE